MFGVALGGFIGAAVFGGVALEADIHGGDELHAVEFCAIGFEDFYDGVDILPVGGDVEGPYVGEYHAVVVCFGKFLEYCAAEFINDGVVVMAEQLDDGLDGHMIMEEPEVGDLCKLLADGHLAHRAFAYYENEFHMSCLPAMVFSSISNWHFIVNMLPNM